MAKKSTVKHADLLCERNACFLARQPDFKSSSTEFVKYRCKYAGGYQSPELLYDYDKKKQMQ